MSSKRRSSEHKEKEKEKMKGSDSKRKMGAKHSDKHKSEKHKDRDDALVLWFKDIDNDDVKLVGGKNASLGEMYRDLIEKGIKIPNGFAVTARAYNYFLDDAKIRDDIKKCFEELHEDYKDLKAVGEKVRKIIMDAEFPEDLSQAITEAYEKLAEQYKDQGGDVAVRSSATAEDLPEASFAGQQESYLNIEGTEKVLHACKKCMASLFTDRAISYREDKGFDHFDVSLSVGVMKMARSDKGAAGTMFSIDTESGFKDIVVINAAWGLGENVVQGAINPDEFIVFKPTLEKDFRPIIRKNLGSKAKRMIYSHKGSSSTENVDTDEDQRNHFCLDDDEVLTLAKWAVIIEQHYSEKNDKFTPMDIEWAKDGKSGEIYIVQARPETVQSQKDLSKLITYKLKGKKKEADEFKEDYEEEGGGEEVDKKAMGKVEQKAKEKGEDVESDKGGKKDKGKDKTKEDDKMEKGDKEDEKEDKAKNEGKRKEDEKDAKTKKEGKEKDGDKEGKGKDGEKEGKGEEDEKVKKGTKKEEDSEKDNEEDTAKAKGKDKGEGKSKEDKNTKNKDSKTEKDEKTKDKGKGKMKEDGKSSGDEGEEEDDKEQQSHINKMVEKRRSELKNDKGDSSKLIKEDEEVVAQGVSVGSSIAAGAARIIPSIKKLDEFKKGEILITEMTDPDWEPILKYASAIVTDSGGRTCHAAIIARELGIPCIVGCGDATSTIKSEEGITVDCARGDTGVVLSGIYEFEEEETDLGDKVETRTKIMMNVADPTHAFALSAIPNSGVGLGRLEFIINNQIGIHPLALLHPDKVSKKEREKMEEKAKGYEDYKEFFIAKLAQGVGSIAAAFYPKPVIVRFSDFKTNEYANLIGGSVFEPKEDNPMLGWRGASRYYDPNYREGFKMECKAILRVRDEFGLDNLQVMIPMIRTVEEAKLVIKELESNGLRREDGVKIIGMCEVPSNVIMADEFLELLDGYSIGSNDLTQMSLGVDRDSQLINDLFDERNETVKRLIKSAIKACKEKGKYCGICGQAPSDYPEFAEWLVEQGIESMSLTNDTVIKTTMVVAKKEKELGIKPKEKKEDKKKEGKKRDSKGGKKEDSVKGRKKGEKDDKAVKGKDSKKDKEKEGKMEKSKTEKKKRESGKMEEDDEDDSKKRKKRAEEDEKEAKKKKLEDKKEKGSSEKKRSKKESGDNEDDDNQKRKKNEKEDDKKKRKNEEEEDSGKEEEEEGSKRESSGKKDAKRRKSSEGKEKKSPKMTNSGKKRGRTAAP